VASDRNFKSSKSLPPRGVFVPVRLAYDRRIGANALRTWICLRGLAWRGGETPPLSIEEIAQLVGKSHSAMYAHLALLRNRNARMWEAAGRGKIRLRFQVDSEASIGSPDGGSESTHRVGKR
jgi:hypothetical protein